MHFSDRNHGAMAGCLDHEIVVMETIDGGARWSKSAIGLPRRENTTSDYCDCGVDNMSWPDARHGWLLVNKHSFAKGESTALGFVVGTVDGGANWAIKYQVEAPVEQVLLTNTQFLDENLGFVTRVGSDDANVSKSDATDALIHTEDAGRTWHRMRLAHPVWACRPYADGLACAAGGEEDFWTLRIRRGK
jgi:photosystem II stability/assembly factor-like uncharacterized protein